MIIKRAISDDLESLNRLMFSAKGYWGYNTDFMKDFMAHFQFTNAYIEKGTTFKAYINDTLIGCFSFSKDAQNQLELDTFFIDPALIRRGFGKQMWAQCLQSAQVFELPFFVLWSDPNANDFYIKMGCEKIGERPSPLIPNRYPAIFKYTF